MIFMKHVSNFLEFFKESVDSKMSDKIPTAEEVLFQYMKEAGFTEDYIKMIYRINRDSAPALIEGIKKFAQLHVEAALKTASEKAKFFPISTWNCEPRGVQPEVNKQSILNAYPKENII